MANAGAGGGRRQSFYSGVAFVFVLISRCHASSIDVYRLIQYDVSGAPFGSRSAYLNHYAASSISAASGSDLSRNVLILYLHELDETFMREYIQQGKPLGGLLLLLPQTFGPDHIKAAEPADFDYTNVKQKLADLEQKLIHCTIQYPVYFAFESQDLARRIANIRRNDTAGQLATLATGGYKLIVTSPTPKKLASTSIINLKGWLPGLKADGDSNQLPTIAIVASYDTFGAVPALSVGSDSNGSGVVALLEIARLFSVLYSNPNTRGRYNILFGLTSGGPYNYVGTQNWLRSFDKGLLESIDYAICLNSLGSVDDRLWLHVSKTPKNAYVKQIFEGLSNVAEELGLTVGIKHKKINASNSRVAWEHEQFSRMGVAAATLSGLSVSPNLLENTGGISDKIEFANEESVVQSVKLVAESLARHIYGEERKASLAVSRHYIKSWLRHLSGTSRMAHFLMSDKASLETFRRISEELVHHVGEVEVLDDMIDDKMFTFYDSTPNTLEIYLLDSWKINWLLQLDSWKINWFARLIFGEYLIILFILPVMAGVWMVLSISSLCRKLKDKVKG